MSDEGERVDGGLLVGDRRCDGDTKLTTCIAPLHDFAMQSGLEVLSIPNQGIKDWQVRPSLSSQQVVTLP
jgi:hypothetical protein